MVLNAIKPIFNRAKALSLDDVFQDFSLFVHEESIDEIRPVVPLLISPQHFPEFRSVSVHGEGQQKMRNAIFVDDGIGIAVVLPVVFFAFA